VCFGTLFSIKLASKMWKSIPDLSPVPEKVERKVWWLTIRKYFQRYRNEHDFTMKINLMVYFSAIIIPISLALHIRYDFSSF